MHIRLASVVFVVALLKIGRTYSEAAPGQSECGETWNFLVAGRSAKGYRQKEYRGRSVAWFHATLWFRSGVVRLVVARQGVQTDQTGIEEVVADDFAEAGDSRKARGFNQHSFTINRFKGHVSGGFFESLCAARYTVPTLHPVQQQSSATTARKPAEWQCYIEFR